MPHRAVASKPPPVYPAWARSLDQVQKDLKVNVATGLNDSEVEARRAQHGFNELHKEAGTPLWKLVLEQFDDMLVKILLVAAVVSFVLAYFEEGSAEEGLRAYIEPFVILLILILNAVVGVWQESNAEAALDALKDLQSDTARVLRDGKHISDLPARELVPGDVVELHPGDKVPADLRLAVLRTATVRAEQASLTGESVAVSKSIEKVAEDDCELQAKDCMLFAGTAISSGTAIGIVVATGMTTEIGKIQEQIHAASLEEEETPLKKKLNEFGELLAKVIFYICVAVWVINYHHFITFELEPGSNWLPVWGSFRFNLSKATYYFKIAVALAVAAIPEGLPAVITTCLALGTRTMAKKNAIVRKLPSVETLGCTTVICSDKTGTLTTNQMSAVQLVALSSTLAVRSWSVQGHTYNPDEGEVVGLETLDRALRNFAEVAAVCNESTIETKNGVFRAVGAPTEAALKVLAEKLGVMDSRLNASFKLQRMQLDGSSAEPVCEHYCEGMKQVALLEFDRDRKSMSVIARPQSGSGNVLLVKGAAECVLERCNRVMLPDGTVTALTQAARQAILDAVEQMAGSALRCLALANKSDLGVLSTYDGTSAHMGHQQLLDLSNYSRIESDLVFLGLAGLKDPPRPEVAGAIRECRRAGIRVNVITGDNKATAEAICKNIGLFAENANLTGKSFTGREFVTLSRERQLQILESSRSCVFSRAEPKHKQDIVRLLKELGEVVAMTGDGVNDAPALKLADIGIAMGITGTEVAKEASDMVLADDNFSSIVAAVSEGRAIYNNMKAFIRYMISSNIGEVAAIFLTAALGLPEGLIPVQLLWVNLVTDGPPATALGFNPPDKDIMEKPPRRADELLITPWLFVRYIIIGTYVGIATVGAFVIWYMYDKFLWIDLSRDGHTTVTWDQLVHWESCPSWTDFKAGPYTAGSQTVSFPTDCDYFTTGKAKASTLSLSVIVLVEMFNAMNALSEDSSLLTTPFWSNPYLLLAILVSTGLHCVILYVPVLAGIFSIVPLSWPEWQLVLLCAFPVILIDEVLKYLGRCRFGTRKVKAE